MKYSLNEWENVKRNPETIIFFFLLKKTKKKNKIEFSSKCLVGKLEKHKSLLAIKYLLRYKAKMLPFVLWKTVYCRLNLMNHE